MRELSDAYDPDDDAEFMSFVEIDGLLCHILDLFELEDFSLPLILHCGAFVISGRPIPFAEYTDRLVETVARGIQRATQQQDVENPGRGEQVPAYFVHNMKAGLDAMAAPFRKPDLIDVDDSIYDRWSEDVMNRTRQPICLEKVVIHGPDGTKTQTPLWRVQLGSISGWSIGTADSLW